MYVVMNREGTGNRADELSFGPFDTFEDADALAVAMEAVHPRAVVLVLDTPEVS